MWDKYKINYTKTLTLSIPVIIAQLGQITVGLVDNIMIGQLGRTELASASFTNTLFSIIIFLGMGFSFALTPLVGKEFGSKNIKQINSWFKNGLITNSLMGLFLVATLTVITFLMPYMGQPQSVIEPSINYMITLLLSIFPMMIFFNFKQFAEGIGNTKIAMNIMLISNVVNIIGNYIFMFGKLGAPEMGLTGAGVGTLISRIVMAGAFIVVFYRHSLFAPFKKALSTELISIAKIKEITKLGIPMGGQMIMEAFAFGFCAIMMGWASELGMAAHQIAINLTTIGFMIYQGLGSGTMIRVSHYRGEHSLKGIKEATESGLHIMLAYSVISMSLFIGARNILPQTFTADVEVINLAAQMLVVCAFFQLFDGIQIIIAGSLRGLADANIPSFFTFVSYFLVAIPFSYASAFIWGYGEIGIWFGFPVGLFVAATLYYCRYFYLTRRKENLVLATVEIK